MPNQDDSALRAVLDDVYTAWADNDAYAFVAPDSHEATAILPGAHLIGREAICAAMAEVFAGSLKGSRAVHEVQSVRYLGGDAAIVISKGAIVMAGQIGPAAETKSLETWVLSKQDGAWCIEAVHSCPANAA
jgi:uncharacterized protein (TIGR02246 family)